MTVWKGQNYRNRSSLVAVRSWEWGVGLTVHRQHENILGKDVGGARTVLYLDGGVLHETEYIVKIQNCTPKRLYLTVCKKEN